MAASSLLVCLLLVSRPAFVAALGADALHDDEQLTMSFDKERGTANRTANSRVVVLIEAGAVPRVADSAESAPRAATKASDQDQNQPDRLPLAVLESKLGRMGASMIQAVAKVNVLFIFFCS